MALIKMDGFKAWVQSALPTVYDDSLSYFELLSKVVYQLNSIITNYNSMVDYVENFTETTNETIQEYIAAYNTLKEYMDNYFENLDVQEEINSKLDEMANTGVLSDLIGNIFIELDAKINSMMSGSPKGVYETLASLQAAYPTGNSNIYVVTADGKWYYYNGGWLPGGTYQSTGIGDSSITKEKINGVVISPNLFNRDTVIENYTISQTGLTFYDGWNASDFIPVTPSTTYIVSHAFGEYLMAYDSNKVFLYKQSSPTATDGKTFSTVAGVYYVRFNIQDAYLENFMCVKGSVLPEYYSRYGNYINWLNLNDSFIKLRHLSDEVKESLITGWEDKKVVTFGDSITWYDGKAFTATHIEYGQIAKGYQFYMREKLGCVVDNQGYSGAHIKLIVSDKVKTYTGYDTTDVVTLTSGANDHRLGFPIGTIGSVGGVFDLNTFYGCLQDGIEYIITQKPDIKIILATPLKGWFTNETTTRYNGEYVISTDYVNAIKKVAELYSLSVVDFYNESDINGLNYYVGGEPYYIGDNPDVWTAYQLHPTQKGFEKMGEVIVNKFKTL